MKLFKIGDYIFYQINVAVKIISCSWNLLSVSRNILFIFSLWTYLFFLNRKSHILIGKKIFLVHSPYPTNIIYM